MQNENLFAEFYDAIWYDTSGGAERNLFTSKNSVVKFCSGIMYLGENLYIANHKGTVSQESYYCVEADAFYLL